MKYKDLKAYHAYYVMAILFFATCFFMHDMVFFPIGCCFICLGWVKQLKEEGRLPDRNQKSTDTPPADSQ